MFDLNMKNQRVKPATNRTRGKGSVPALRTPFMPTVLHIDDDPNDTELLQAAARRANVRFSIHSVTDGEQAMAYLNGRGAYANRRLFPFPALVLLDLKMPRATGFDVLQWIRAQPEAGGVPVVIFSGSELQDDIRQAYAVGADSYLVKPIGFNALVKLVQNLEKALIVSRSGGVTVLDEAQFDPDWRRGGDVLGRRSEPQARP
jgi:CheY-like chemotaxis protein